MYFPSSLDLAMPFTVRGAREDIRCNLEEQYLNMLLLNMQCVRAIAEIHAKTNSASKRAREGAPGRRRKAKVVWKHDLRIPRRRSLMVAQLLIWPQLVRSCSRFHHRLWKTCQVWTWCSSS